MKNKYLYYMDDVLSYLPFKIPEEVLEQIFKNPKLKKETKEGGLEDTEEREILLNEVLKVLSLPKYEGVNSSSWPLFFKRLTEVAAKYNLDISVAKMEEEKRLESLKQLHNVKLVLDHENYKFTLNFN